jgi:large subunit ribosomal protein L20
MPRAVDGTRHKDRRKKILKLAKGYWGRRSKLYRTAKDAVAKSLTYAYRDRKNKKRSFRSLWITRISAGCRAEGLSYSRFMNGLKRANVQMNRKTLSNLAIEDRDTFRELVGRAKSALDSPQTK